MNAIDICIVILLVVSNLNGVRQGLIKALAGLVGWFLALLLAVKFSPDLQPVMVKYTADPTMQKIAAFASIIFAVLILAWLAGQLLHKLIQQMKLSWLNRLAGGGFGLAKSIIIVLVMMHGLAPWFSHTKIWQNSKMVEILVPYSAQATEYTQQAVQKTAAELERHQSDEQSDNPQDEMDSGSKSESKVDNPFL